MGNEAALRAAGCRRAATSRWPPPPTGRLPPYMRFTPARTARPLSVTAYSFSRRPPSLR